jgi:hypothetical protein
MVKYVSEFDQWLKKYKQQNPETEQQQREGRALLWEKQSDQINSHKQTAGLCLLPCQRLHK